MIADPRGKFPFDDVLHDLLLLNPSPIRPPTYL